MTPHGGHSAPQCAQITHRGPEPEGGADPGPGHCNKHAASDYLISVALQLGWRQGSVRAWSPVVQGRVYHKMAGNRMVGHSMVDSSNRCRSSNTR